MYLAKLAYLPYRNAFRAEIYHRQQQFDMNEFKETKEPDYDTERFRHAFYTMHKGTNFASESLVANWLDSQIGHGIRNPVPRHQWGKDAPSHGDFKWVLQDGIWVRNYGG
jgi:hypothetical protein